MDFLIYVLWKIVLASESKMVNIKSLDAITDKWATETPARAPYYEKGVAAPAADFATEAIKGQKAYEEAMRDPSILKLREKRIKETGTEKWQRKAKSVGPSRYREGVPAAKEDFTKGFSTYHGVISALVLPEKGKRGDPKNYARVKAIGDALHAKRVGSV